MMARILILGLLLCGLVAAQDPLPEKDPTSRPKSSRRGRRPPKKPEAKEEEKKEEPKKEEEKPWFAIVGADIHPVSSPVIRGGTILFRDGKIVKVGGQVKVPEGATVIPAEGRHVCPGFVATLSSGVFGRARSRKDDKLKDSLNPFGLQMQMALAAGITTAHIGASSSNPFAMLFGGGGGLGGSATGTLAGTVGKLTYGTLEGFELRDPAGLYFVYSQSRSSQRDQTRKILGDVRKYLKERTEWVQAVQGGKKDAKPPKLSSKLKPWVRVYDGEIPAFVDASTRTGIEAVLALCDEFDLPVVLTGAEESWIIPGEIGRRNVSVMVNTRGAGFDHFRYRVRPGKSEFQDGAGGWSLETARKLEDAGIPWAAVTQHANIDFGGIPGRDLQSLTMAAGSRASRP